MCLLVPDTDAVGIKTFYYPALELISYKRKAPTVKCRAHARDIGRNIAPQPLRELQLIEILMWNSRIEKLTVVLNFC